MRSSSHDEGPRCPSRDRTGGGFHRRSSLSPRRNNTRIELAAFVHPRVSAAVAQAAGSVRRFVVRRLGHFPDHLARPLLNRSFFRGSDDDDEVRRASSQSRGTLSDDSESESEFRSSTKRRRSQRRPDLPARCTRMLEDEEEGLSCWGAVVDLDRFVDGMYKYWLEGGLYAIVSSHVAHIFTLSFTVYFSWFLMMFVNWNGILSCASAEACGAVPLLTPSPFHPWGMHQALGTIYVLSLSGFVILTVVSAYMDCREALMLRSYFYTRLHIHSDASLQLMDWPEVVALLLRAQQEHTFCPAEDLSVLDLVNVIMRQDNYFIALANKELLTKALPRWIPPRIIFTPVLLWNIKQAIFGNLFNSKRQIDANLFGVHPVYSCRFRTEAARRMAHRFCVLAFLNLILLIPLVLFNTIYFFLKYAEDVRLQHVSLVHREFTGYAQWIFREFNELPHQINQRLSLAAEAADAYLLLYPQSPALYRLQNMLKYIVGAILAIFVLVYIVDDSPMLFVRVGNRNLLWYTVVLGVIYGGLRKLDSRKVGCSVDQRNGSTTDYGSSSHAIGLGARRAMRQLHCPLQLYERCMAMVSYTHYLPPSWLSASSKISFISPIPGDSTDMGTNFSSKNITRGMNSRIQPEFLGHNPHKFFQCHPDAPPHGPSQGVDRQADNGSSFQPLTCEGDQDAAFRCVSEQHRKVMQDLCQRFYCLRLVSILNELFAVLLTPILLGWYFPSIADEICDFIHASTVSTAFGDLCCFASLDVDSYGSENYLPNVRSPIIASEKRGASDLKDVPKGDTDMRAERAPESICAKSPIDAECVGSDTKRWNHIAPSVVGRRGGPVIPALKRYLPSNGKVEKSAINFLLSYRISAPYDDTSPMWTMLAANELTQSLMAASTRDLFSNPRASFSHTIGYHIGQIGGMSRPLIFWGEPACVGALYDQLAEFQQQMLREQPFLLQEIPDAMAQPLRTAAWYKAQCRDGTRSTLLDICGPPPISEEEKSSVFFWIEKVYEVNSGRVLFATNQINFYTRSLFKQNTCALPRMNPSYNNEGRHAVDVQTDRLRPGNATALHHLSDAQCTRQRRFVFSHEHSTNETWIPRWDLHNPRTLASTPGHNVSESTAHFQRILEHDEQTRGFGDEQIRDTRRFERPTGKGGQNFIVQNATSTDEQYSWGHEPFANWQYPQNASSPRHLDHQYRISSEHPEFLLHPDRPVLQDVPRRGFCQDQSNVEGLGSRMLTISPPGSGGEFDAMPTSDDNSYELHTRTVVYNVPERQTRYPVPFNSHDRSIHQVPIRNSEQIYTNFTTDPGKTTEASEQAATCGLGVDKYVQ